MKPEDEYKKYSISSSSHETKNLFDRILINIELGEAVKKAGEELNLKMSKGENIEEDEWYISAHEIIEKYHLVYNWDSFIVDWMVSGKRPEIKFDNEIKIELYPADEKNQYWVPALPQFSYVTITAPLSADSKEITDLFERAQEELVSPIKPNKKIRPHDDPKLRSTIIDMYLEGIKVKDIAKFVSKTDKPTSQQIYDIYGLISNYRKQDLKFLHVK